jgi:HEAT repeat protein
MFSFRTTLIIVPLAFSLLACMRTPQSSTERPGGFTAAPDTRATVVPQQTAVQSSRLPTDALGSGPAEPLLPEEVAEEVDSLVQELRDLPGDLPARACTPCNTVSKVIGAKRRREIYDGLHALGSAAVPELARMLQSSLRGSDKDLTSTVLWILSSVSGPYTDRNGKQHEGSDISAALPTLILALDDPNARALAASAIGAIGPRAAETLPKLMALLDDNDVVVRMSACNGLRGIDPLPALRQARSDPNPDKRQSAQRTIASIETICLARDRSETRLEELARTADLICKATVVADRSVIDDSFKPAEGFEVREAELRVVSSLKGGPPNVIRFRYYGRPQSSPASALTKLLRDAYDYLSGTYNYLSRKGETERNSFSVGRTYFMVASQIAGGTYREMAAFVPPSHRTFFVTGPPPPYYGMISPGVLLAADAKPHRGTTLTEAAWTEQLALLKSPREDDVLEAVHLLDRMSGGPAWERRGPTIFERDEVLVAIEPLIESKSVDIAVSAVTVFGGDSPYFYDHDVPFWLVGIGKGRITGLGARKRPPNPVVANIGAKELLQVATYGMTPKLRALAIRALGRRPYAYPAAIVSVWARDPNVEVRRAAVLASADVPDREPIVAASTDGSPDTRCMAAVAVAFAQDPHLLPLLERLLHDPVADVRSTAALSLLSYPADQAAQVMDDNLTSDFRLLFPDPRSAAICWDAR